MSAAEYNAKSMAKYGWSPVDLGLPASSEPDSLVDAIRAFQEEHNLVVDGRLGPATWRRVQASQEGLLEPSEGHILVAGELVPVSFKTKTLTSDSPFSLVGRGGHSRRKNPPTQVVWHWDACLNGETCYRILKRRKISSHGVIDNDGTFIQFLDFSLHTGWHAGDSKVNKASIGIDITNAVYLKYAGYYDKRWGPRPVIEPVVHGHKYEILGYYPEQVETARLLSILIEDKLNIQRSYPPETEVVSKPHLHKGHLAHYHVKRTKFDVAGFPFEKVLG